MSVRVFVDTNVLVYAKDLSHPTKQRAAQHWLEALAARNAIVVSAQSLREYYNAATNPKKTAIPRQIARREVAALHAWLPADGGLDRLPEAWEIQDRFQLAFFDSMLLAAALTAKCTHFLSEDLHAGLNVNGALIVNFMTVSPEELLG